MERRLQPERMDAPGLNPRDHHSALAGLRRINAVSGVSRIVWRSIRQIAQRQGLEHFSILDVACGGGDLLASLAKRARRNGVSIQLAGCDISPTATSRASGAFDFGGTDADFFVTDAIADPLPKGYDFVISTLFLHHLDWRSSLRLLKHLRLAAQRAVIVDDLVRSRTGHALAWAGCRLLSRSPIVHYDGPVSVLGAYTESEARELAAEAGLEGARLRKHWPCRFLMEWERQR